VREHDLTVTGDFPHNTNRADNCRSGQAGAAGGYLGLVEAIRQVTGGPGRRRSAGATARWCLGFGMINYDRGVCSAAAIFSGGGA
jgi:hypothetical protein